ncbi:hypothetical protein HK405_007868, partial [Cladochytrium tenue]
MSYRSSTFDPALVVGQIVCLQSAYYLSLSVVVLALELVTGSPVTLDHLLLASELRTGTAMGWCLAGAFLLNAAISSFLLLLIVQRAKQCLDFSATIQLLHAALTTAYSGGLPRSSFWWGVAAIGVVVSALGGEFLCMRHELQPIAFGSALARLRAAAAAAARRVQRTTADGAGVAAAAAAALMQSSGGAGGGAAADLPMQSTAKVIIMGAKCFKSVHGTAAHWHVEHHLNQHGIITLRNSATGHYLSSDEHGKVYLSTIDHPVDSKWTLERDEARVAIKGPHGGYLGAKDPNALEKMLFLNNSH